MYSDYSRSYAMVITQKKKEGNIKDKLSKNLPKSGDKHNTQLSPLCNHHMQASPFQHTTKIPEPPTLLSEFTAP